MPFNLEKTPGNRLRRQKFNIAFLDDDMKIIHTEVHQTSDKENVTHCAYEKPAAAILINHGSQGYGKFVLDQQTIEKLLTSLSKLD